MTKKQQFIRGVIYGILIGAVVLFALYMNTKRTDAQNLAEYNKAQSLIKEGWEIGYMQAQIDIDESTNEELKLKKQSDQNKILQYLAHLESSSGKKRKILDVNGKYSLGLYHFQATTVQDMYKRYYKKNIDIMEAVRIAENDELSTKLAHDAIFVKKELSHWHNSMIKMNKLGLIQYGK